MEETTQEINHQCTMQQKILTTEKNQCVNNDILLSITLNGVLVLQIFKLDIFFYLVQNDDHNHFTIK